MKTTNINIRPFAIKSASLATIGEAKVHLGLGKVVVPVMLYDEYGMLLDTRHAELSGDAYNRWASDDKYLVAAALAAIGVTPAEDLGLPEAAVKKAEEPQATIPAESDAANEEEQPKKRKKNPEGSNKL